MWESPVWYWIAAAWFASLPLNSKTIAKERRSRYSSVLSNSAEYELCIGDTFRVLESSSSFPVDVVHGRSIYLNQSSTSSEQIIRKRQANKQQFWFWTPKIVCNFLTTTSDSFPQFLFNSWNWSIDYSFIFIYRFLNQLEDRRYGIELCLEWSTIKVKRNV